MPTNVTLQGSRLAVEFPYEALVPKTTVPIRNDIKLRFPGSRWSPTGKKWIVPLNSESYRDLLQVYEAQMAEEVHKAYQEMEALLTRPGITDAPPPGFTPRLLPFPPMSHQITSLNFHLSRMGTANFSWMGTGKTRTVIEWACYLHKHEGMNRLLLVCPSPIMENEANEFSQWTWEQMATKIALVEGSGSRKASVLYDLVSTYATLPHLVVAIINYEAFLSPEVQKACALFLKSGNSAIVCDEATRIKNPQAQRTKAIVKLRDFARRRMILTGTPIAEKRVDIYGQYLFLEPRIFGESFTAFKSKYCVMGGFQEKEIVNYKETDDFMKRLWCCAIKFGKDECLDLPAKRGGLEDPAGLLRREFLMPTPMARAHAQMAKELLIELDGKEYTAPIVLTKFMRLQEITSGYIRQGDQVGRFPGGNPKAEILNDILDESSDPKIVVWCREKEEIKIVEETVAKRKDMGIFTLHGGTKDQHGTAAAWQKAPDRAVLACQVQTGSLGFTWVEATLAVYFSNSWPLLDRQQSEDRIHRKGQTNKVTYIELIAKDSVDDYILDKLKKKKGDAASLMDIKEALKKWSL